MNRIATVNYTKVVTRCEECPFFDDHPQEASCKKLYEMNKKDPWESFVKRKIIDPRCPLPFSEDKK
jgi:hypothetical protein